MKIKIKQYNILDTKKYLIESFQLFVRSPLLSILIVAIFYINFLFIFNTKETYNLILKIFVFLFSPIFIFYLFNYKDEENIKNFKNILKPLNISFFSILIIIYFGFLFFESSGEENIDFYNYSFIKIILFFFIGNMLLMFIFVIPIIFQFTHSSLLQFNNFQLSNIKEYLIISKFYIIPLLNIKNKTFFLDVLFLLISSITFSCLSFIFGFDNKPTFLLFLTFLSFYICFYYIVLKDLCGGGGLKKNEKTTVKKENLSVIKNNA